MSVQMNSNSIRTASSRNSIKINSEVCENDFLADLDECPGHNSAIRRNRTKIEVIVHIELLPVHLNDNTFHARFIAFDFAAQEI